MTYEYCKRNTLRSGHNHTISVDADDDAQRHILLNYYNEYEPFAAEWLKELIKDGLIPDGEVDTRSIVDVAPEDLKDFKQCHFFAGIGGWAYAARLAGWGDDRPMWTGSPPCQPFSVAGKQDGASDERHLWPIWFDLLRKCRPPIVFGEQVSAAITFGWLDQLQTDLESSDYRCGAILVPASGVGALHQRDRLWFVADRMREGLQRSNPWGQDAKWRLEPGYPRRSSSTDGLVDSNDIRHERGQEVRREAKRWAEYASNTGIELADTASARLQGQQRQKFKGAGIGRSYSGDSSKHSLADGDNPRQRTDGGPVQQDQRNNAWGGCQAMQCKDGKVRLIPTEPEIFPLAHGIPNRVGMLRGAGNAIVPQVAAEIIGLFV